MSLLAKKSYKVERKVGPEPDATWYECILSPFATFEQASQYIELYRNYYPHEHQNYKITYET